MGSRPCLHGGRLFAGMGRLFAGMKTGDGFFPVFMGAGSSRALTGWVPASARTRGVGDGFPSLSSWGRLFAGMTRGWVPASARTRVGMGSLSSWGKAPRATRGWVPASARTTEGVGDGFPSLSSWGKALRGHDEGMGPRIREDKSGDGFPSLSSWGQALRGHEGDGSPHPGTRAGD